MAFSSRSSQFFYLKRLFPSLFINKDVSSFQCETCQFAKNTRVSYPLRPHLPSAPFSLIHSDIWGPSRITSLTGSKWFITFIDDHSHACWVYLLKEKSDATMVFKNFRNMVETQFQKKIQVFRTDNGGEYFNSILGKYLSDNGIFHQSSCVGTPQQNGVLERKNRHLLEVARALLFNSHVPKYFWGEAILTATYLINRLPSRVINFQTPLHVLQNAYPSNHLFHTMSLKVFGCTAYVHDLNPSLGKLDPKAQKCIFLRYSPTQKGYKCYSPKAKINLLMSPFSKITPTTFKGSL